MFSRAKLARCQGDTKKNIQRDPKLEHSLPGQTLQPPRRQPDATGSYTWGVATDRLDMTALVRGLAGKDCPVSTAEERVKRWHQEIACEKLIEGVRLNAVIR